jgi:hypothetical protein
VVFPDRRAKVFVAYACARNGSQACVIQKYGLGLRKFAGGVEKKRSLAVVGNYVAGKSLKAEESESSV